jgi:deoxyhypusine monooxygenase
MKTSKLMTMEWNLMMESINALPSTHQSLDKHSHRQVDRVTLAHDCELMWNDRGRTNARGYALMNVGIADLIDTLGSSDRLLRVKALFVLSFFETSLIIEAVKNTLKNDECPIVRHEAAYFLGNMQCQEAIDCLGEALINDQNEIVRHEAAEALGEIGTAAAIFWLQKAKLDPSNIVRDTVLIAESLVKSRNENLHGN